MSEPREQRRRIDLRARLTAGVAGASLLIGSAIVVVVSWSGIRAELARQGRTQARQLAVLAREPLAAGDADRLAALLRPLAAMDGVLEVSLVSGSGRIAASTRTELSGAKAPAAYLTDSAGIASFAPGTPEAGRDAMLFVAPVQAREASAQRAEGERRRAPAETAREASAQQAERAASQRRAESIRLAEGERRRAPAEVAGGSVVLRLSTADLARARRELILFNLTAAGAGIGILTAAAWWLLGVLLRPVGAVQLAIESLAAGASRARMDPTRLGALSGVGDAINRLAASHQAIAGRVAEIADRFHAVVERVAQTASEMEEETEEQSRRVEEVSSRLGQVSASIERIGEEVRGISEDTEHVSSAVFELGGGLEETARSMGAVDEAIDASSSSSQEMSASIREIAGHAEQVRHAAADTAELMRVIDATIQQVDERAQQASELVAQVNRSTEQGAEAVATTVRGSQEAQSRVLEAKQALHDLADRLGRIDEVMGVLEAINEETSLLALNAAIIAAQAGEHGRAFAVVAGQVRALARRTAASMKHASRGPARGGWPTRRSARPRWSTRSRAPWTSSRAPASTCWRARSRRWASRVGSGAGPRSSGRRAGGSRSGSARSTSACRRSSRMSARTARARGRSPSRSIGSSRRPASAARGSRSCSDRSRACARRPTRSACSSPS